MRKVLGDFGVSYCSVSIHFSQSSVKEKHGEFLKCSGERGRKGQRNQLNRQIIF